MTFSEKIIFDYWNRIRKEDRKKYVEFRNWMWEYKQWHTRNWITSIKPEYLIEYTNEFNGYSKSRCRKVPTNPSNGLQKPLSKDYF
jgi:hypothetical protein